jgi:hypothetical protein
MSPVEIKVVTVVVTKNANSYNGLYGLSPMSPMSPLKKHILYTAQMERLHITVISRNEKGTYCIIYIVFF